jgi:hypothetical protein
MTEHIAGGAPSSDVGAAAPAGGPVVGGRLSPAAMLGVVLRIALTGAGRGEPFAGLRPRLADALLPLALSVVIAVAGAAAGPDTRSLILRDPTAPGVADLMALHAAVNLARILVATGVTYIVAQLFAADRIWPGLIAYLWANVLFVSPWLVLITQVVDATDPELWAILASAGGLVLAVAAMARVMRAALNLPDRPSAIFVSVAGAVLSGALMLLTP